MKLKWKKAFLIKQHVLNKKWINPFHANVAFQYPLKTSENLTGLFYTPWKHQKTKGIEKDWWGFLSFSGGIEMGHWREKG